MIVQNGSAITSWHPNAWTSLPNKQPIEYKPDSSEYISAIEKLQTYPPLVTPKEIDRLQAKLRDVAEGKAFLLQGGDCAERLVNSQESIEAKLKVLLQMSLVLVWGARMPVVRIGRIAGQYAKPRSSLIETLANGKTVPSFRGENINGINPDDREHDPDRLVQGYLHAATTLNYARALLSSGFADLHAPDKWLLGHVKNQSTLKDYQAIVDSVLDSLSFVKAIGADNPSIFENVDIYASHEALVLDFEAAMTRLCDGIWYDTSAHFVWIGDRTRGYSDAHIEFVRGLQNPIGLKIGPTITGDEIVDLLDKVNPDKLVGKVTLICRYGVANVESLLPSHIAAVRKSGHKPIWSCDPMHGNTKKSVSHPEIKTRSFADIVGELTKSFQVHRDCQSQLNGLHFELTGDIGVTECTGGSMEVTDESLGQGGFQSICDPRLNYEQSMDVAFLVARQLRR